MKKIEWRLNQKNGIELVEPNDNLSKAYIKKAEDALKASTALENNKDWKISSLYYTMYFSLYAILIKLGIKCEIHSCTIEFMNQHLSDYYNNEDTNLLKKSMKARIDAQYYTDRNISDEQYKNIQEEAPKFLIKSKETIHKLTEDKTKDIREKLIQLNKK